VRGFGDLVDDRVKDAARDGARPDNAAACAILLENASDGVEPMARIGKRAGRRIVARRRHWGGDLMMRVAGEDTVVVAAPPAPVVQLAAGPAGGNQHDELVELDVLDLRSAFDVEHRPLLSA
jgi:hypothetical protein